MYDKLKRWRRDGFTLLLYDTGEMKDSSHSRLAYKLYDGKELIFKGEDFGCSPCHAIDSPQCIASLLLFLSLRPGDTDREYFDRYTLRQMAWCCGSRCELLACYQNDIEERVRARR